MKQAWFRFYAQLNDFLTPGRRQVSFAHAFELSRSVKDMLEALGVPHTEVGLILVNGRPVDFSWLVQDRDRISVYPPFRSIDISPFAPQRAPEAGEARFVLDTHLGRLAAYLRLLGFDTLYRNDFPDAELAQISSREGRILLSMDRGLLKRNLVTRGYCVREADPRRQVVEVLQWFDLLSAIAPFRRCLRCNALLQAVSKEAVRDRLPPKTRQFFDEFRLCPACDRIYWKGSHYQRMQRFIARVLTEAGSPAGRQRYEDAFSAPC